MKISYKILLFGFVFLFFNSSIVLGSSLVCCYNLNSGILKITSSCSNGEINLGNSDFTYSSTNGCKKVEDNLRRGYKINSICYATYKGKKIYNNPKVLDSFDSSFDKSKVVNYDNSCNGDTGVISNTGTTGDGTSNIGNSGSSIVGDNNEIDIPFQNTVDVTEERNFCKDAGNPMGFFSSKDSCNSFETSSGKKTCIYNPYLAGYLATDFINSDAENLNFDLFETGCIPKIAITSCSNYKTKENCNIGDNCIWKDSSDYSPILGFNNENGICISNKISKTTYFNPNGYIYRGNLIKNPSFEDNPNKYWQSQPQSLQIKKGNTFNRNNYAWITSNSLISQQISGIGSKISYSTFMYIYAKNFNNQSTITLDILPLDSSNTEITGERYSETIKLYDIYNNNRGNYFKKLIFKPVTFSDEVASIIFKIKSIGHNIGIDAVDFQPTKSNGATINELIFNPLEIISEEGSNCNLCFDKLNFNFCTKKKSDLLGDCTYLVKSSDKKYESELKYYFGKDSNKHIISENYTNWKAQSLSNSKMFCEMYVDKTQCLDPNNFVNKKYSKLHLSTDKLCKWNSIHGCFKDSDNNGYPDTRNANVYLRANNENTYKIFNSFSNYIYERNETFPNSDFDLGCDMVPPSSYIYFSAKNSNAEDIIINNNFADLTLPIGNININVYVSDYLSNSCGDYDIKSILYLDYNVSGEIAYRKIYSNQLKEFSSIQDYFKNSSGGSLIKDGINEISIIIKDQSGNIEGESSFKINADISGPVINLISHPTTDNGNNFWVVNSFITPANPLKFKIGDYSKVRSCSFNLDPQTNVPDDYYNATGEFNLSSIQNLKKFNYDFNLPVKNSTVDGDVYLLSIICSDIFSQQTINQYLLNVDFRTDLVLISPRPYINYTFDPGYLNSPTNFNFVSTEKNISSCSIIGATGTLTPTSIQEGFEITEYQGEIFYTNISGELTPNNLGRNEINVTCTDINGNIAKRNMVYYYDTIKPILKNFSLVDTSSGSISKVVKINGEYYTYDNDPGYFKVNFDSTRTWLSDKNLSLEVIAPSSDVSFIIDAEFNNFNLTEDTTEIDSCRITKFTSFMDDTIGYYGEDVSGEPNLKEVKYNLNFTDKAMNLNSAKIKYYYDRSNPSFNFTGDIISQDGNRIYTNKNNPRFQVGFNTPSYRTYTCEISVSDSFTYQKSFDTPTNSLSFNLNEISSSLSLSNNQNLGISFDCRDIYNISLKGDFILVYDNTRPELNRLFLSKGNEKYFINRENVAYDDLVDNLVFDLNDTSEELYNCYYRFTSSSNIYSCNSSWNKIKFIGGELTSVENLVLLSGTNYNPNAICIRTDRFKTVQNGHIANNEDFLTHLIITGYCEDGVKLQTEKEHLDVGINYISSELIDLNFNIIDGIAYPIVRSMMNLDNVVISYNNDGSDQLLRVTNGGVDNSGIYTYTSSEGIDTHSLKVEHNVLWAVALTSDESVISAVFNTLDVDLFAPTLNLNVPDKDFENKIYSDRFEVNFNVEDLNSGIKLIELYQDGNKIFSMNQTNLTYDNISIDIPVLSMNTFSNNFKNFRGTIFFKNAVENQKYNFILKAYDMMSNQNETNQSITIGTGIGLRLIDTTDNSFTDSTRMYWMTAKNNPVISFETSKPVSKCIIYPFIDNRWEEITGDDIISQLALQKTNSGNSRFVYDLANFAEFNLSKFDQGEQIPIKISCDFENKKYNYTRHIVYMTSLPDYVLTSSNGFILTDSPYTSEIEITSVGVFSEISCSYAIDSNTYTEFSINDKSNFKKKFDFSSYSNGIHNLKIRCHDLIGTYGPEKTYQFKLDKGSNLEISDFYLYKNSNKFKYSENSNTIYIDNRERTDLEFNLNRKTNITCTYLVNSVSDSIIGHLISYILDLFTNEKKDMTQNTNSYKFKAENIKFNEGTNKLNIKCSNDISSIEKEYTIITNNETISTSSSLTFLN